MKKNLFIILINLCILVFIKETSSKQPSCNRCFERTIISKLPFPITSPGIYCINSALNIPATSKFGVEIASNNVRIITQGAGQINVSNSGTTAIRTKPGQTFSNIILNKPNILINTNPSTNMSFGISIQGQTVTIRKAQIKDISSTPNSTGIALINSSDVKNINPTIIDCKIGISVDPSVRVGISNGNISATSQCITTNGTSTLSINNSKISSATGSGISAGPNVSDLNLTGVTVNVGALGINASQGVSKLNIQNSQVNAAAGAVNLQDCQNVTVSQSSLNSPSATGASFVNNANLQITQCQLNATTQITTSTNCKFSNVTFMQPVSTNALSGATFFDTGFFKTLTYQDSNDIANHTFFLVSAGLGPGLKAKAKFKQSKVPAITLKNCSGCTFENGSIANGSEGFHIEDSPNNAIIKCHIHDNTIGVNFIDSDSSNPKTLGNIITDSVITGNTTGIGGNTTSPTNLASTSTVLSNNPTNIVSGSVTQCNGGVCSPQG